MLLQSEKKETIVEIMPIDWTSFHKQTCELNISAGERIVAARVAVDKERRLWPCELELLIYDLV